MKQPKSVPYGAYNQEQLNRTAFVDIPVVAESPHHAQRKIAHRYETINAAYTQGVVDTLDRNESLWRQRFPHGRREDHLFIAWDPQKGATLGVDLRTNLWGYR